MDIDITGPWQKPEIEQFLTQASLPIRLSCVAADGYPRVVSLWFRYEGDALHCVTHNSSKLVRLLEKEQRVGFEIAADAPPYHGVRGQGIATLQPLGSDSALEQLLDHYIGDLKSDFSLWLLSRKQEELLITVRPHRLFSWDYRQRMSDIV